MPFASGPLTAGLRAFLDLLTDAVVVLDRDARVSFANGAALRLLGCEPGLPLHRFAPLIGEAATRWLQQVLKGAAPGAPPEAQLAHGRRATLAWQRLDARHSALRLAVQAAAAPPAAPGEIETTSADVLQWLWSSPFPVVLQDEAFRLLEVNRAWLEFTGYRREAVIGRDPIELQPPEDRPAQRAWRDEMRRALAAGRGAPLIERRLLDAGGQERWLRAVQRPLPDAHGRMRYLTLLQDCSAEHAARERADRSVLEIDQWFDLSTVGMVLFDEAGLLVRTNVTFEALAGEVPVVLSEATPALRDLLGWTDAGALPQLQPGGSAVERHGWLAQADGRMRRLRAVVRCCSALGSPRRFLGVVEDRSAEEERDLAQLQIGALMDTAGVGIATFGESVGWLRGAPAAGATPQGAGALQGVRRELVMPDSLPEFERLQQALRGTERAEARYAIRHPELGLRWLHTRIEPATLASGQRTTSVVTLDVTEQHESQQRGEQLLRELTTILESSPAGIAYVRGDALVRCNRRFETMLGLQPAGVAGSTLRELFGRQPQVRRIAEDSRQALERGLVYETEFEWEVDGDDATPGRPARWYALSVRGTASGGGPREAIAVLSDITRLKRQRTQLEVLARDRELMFSLSGVGIAFVRGGCIERANEALAGLCGQPVDELVGQPLSALLAQAGASPHADAEQERALAVFGRWSGEWQLRRRDGRLLWVQASLRLVREGDPASGLIASCVDVDGRHRAEQAVALQAERTRTILDSVLVGIVTVGASGIEWMNRSARRMFAGELSDFLGQPIAVAATAEPDHPLRRDEALHELEPGQARTFECRVVARDGRRFRVVGNVVATGSRAAPQLTYALLDVEPRRQAEARSAVAQSQLRRIIEAAPMAITLLDAATLAVVQINEVAAASLRSTPEALAGRTPEQIFPPALAPARRASLERALASPGVTHIEYTFRSGGMERVWDARCVPLSTDGQAPDQLLLVAADVTDQRAAQEARLEAAIAQREMLVKEVHHRIKNNLQGVAGLLQQIAARKPEVAAPISEIVGQVQAIAQVYGLGVGVTGPLRLHSVAEAITGSVQRTFGRSIVFEAGGVQPLQWALPETESIPIALVLNELLTNAVKHGAPGDAGTWHCRLELECVGDAARLHVANPGRLPDGFSLATFPGGVSGLGLVRALLPRRGASLAVAQHGEQVVATVELRAPVLTRIAG